MFVIILQFTCWRWLLLPGFLGGELLFYRNMNPVLQSAGCNSLFLFCFGRNFCTPAKVAAWASGLLIKGIVFPGKINAYTQLITLIHSHGHFLLTYCKRRQKLWWVPFIAMTPTFAAFLISPYCLEENGAIPLWCCIRSFKDQSPRMVEAVSVDNSMGNFDPNQLLDSPTSSLPECSRSNMPVLQDQELTFFGIVAHLTFQTWDVTLPQAGWSQVQPPQSILPLFRENYTLPTAASSI